MIADYEAAGASASQFMPYGLTFEHKHLPEMTAYAKLAHAPLFVPAVGNFAQGMTTFVPLQLGELDKVPTGARHPRRHRRSFRRDQATASSRSPP